MARKIKSTSGDRMSKQQKKILAAEIYFIIFLIVSIVLVLIWFFANSKSWLFIVYLILSGIFVYVILMIITYEQPRTQRNELMQELNETKTYMQQIQLQKRQEQLNALQSQINPHFLYNTLDTIRGMAIEKDSMDIANTVAALASMFKYSVDYASTNVAISDEVAHLKKYLEIQRIRFKNRFDVEWIYECDEESLHRVTIPKLTLQPIVENALTHGLKNKIKDGMITIRFIESDTQFRIVVSDNGSGIPEDMIISLNNSFMGNNIDFNPMNEAFPQSIALSNINTRIKIYCGQEFGLFVASTLGVGTEMTLTLPVSTGE